MDTGSNRKKSTVASITIHLVTFMPNRRGKIFSIDYPLYWYGGPECLLQQQNGGALDQLFEELLPMNHGNP
nr:unnamed protein product [Callosobruchus chinensis]